MPSTEVRKLRVAVMTIATSVVLLAAPGSAAWAERLFDLLPAAGPENRAGRGPIESRMVAMHADTIERGDADLTLPLLDGSEVSAHLVELDVRAPGDTYWRGGIEGGGDVTLTLARGYVVGQISTSDARYEIHTVAGGGQALTRVDRAPFLPCGAPIADDGGDPDLAEAAASKGVAHAGVASIGTGEGGPATIDVMVLFTAAARDGAGGLDAMMATIAGAVDSANASFTSSGIDARLDLAHVALADHADAGNLVLDLYWLRTDPDVAALRDRVGADLVALLVEETGDYCGQAQILSSLEGAPDRRAFSVTARPCLGDFTFAHEIGHNLGLGHDPGTAGASGLEPWSRGHWVDGLFRTVMSYIPPACAHCPHLAQFSNPKVVHAGVPTGIDGERDNARTANLSAPIVARYRDAPPRSALAHADLDGDGREELLVDFGAAGGLWSWRGARDWRRLHPFSPVDIAAGDLDGNGREDLVAGFGAGVWAWMNDAGWVLRRARATQHVAAADLSGDGRDDLVADFGVGQGLAWQARESTAWSPLDPRSPELLVEGDFDGNGRDDLAIDFGPPYGLWAWVNHTSWQPAHAGSPDLMASGDFDGDGKDDLAAGFGPSGLWTSSGASSWVQRHVDSPELLAAGDLDGNGSDEIAADFGVSQGLWVWSNGAGWLQRHPLSPRLLTLGDFAGNGRDEMAIDLGPTHGLWLWSEVGPWTQRHRTSPELIAVGDLDGNGRKDLVLDFGDGLGLWIWSNDSVWIKRHSSSPLLAATGDLDGDGRDDLVLDFGPPSGLWAWMNDSTWIKRHAKSPEAIAIGDLDGNGRQDLIADFGPVDGLWLWANDATWTPLHASSPELFVTGDVDGNGSDELIADFGAQGLWVRSGGASWTKRHASSPELLATGDLDGSGRDEIIADFGPAQGLWVLVDGTTWTQRHTISPTLLAVGDLDGSGREDLIADFGPEQGLWVWSNDSAWVKRHHASAEAVAAADLDFDGTEELVVDFGPAYGLWIWKSAPGWARIDPPAVARRTDAPVCAPSPRVHCQATGRAGASRLSLSVDDDSAASTAALAWQWRGAVAAEAFGDPLTDAGMAFCLYDSGASGQPVLAAVARAGEPCANTSCWSREVRNGRLEYASAGPLGNDEGMRRIVVRPGAESRGRLRVDVRGAKLSRPALPLAAPVIAQLQSATGECWSSRFAGSVQRSDATHFRAASD